MTTECTLTSFVALRMRSEGNIPTDVGGESWCLLRDNAPAHRSGLVDDFLTKSNVTTQECSHILSWTGSSWLLTISSTEIRNKGMELVWCYWYKECGGRAEKSLTKLLSGMFPTPLQTLEETYSCTRELFWSKFSLSDCTVLYFSQLKLFREHLEANSQWRSANGVTFMSDLQDIWIKRFENL